jgi:uracil-DNA glycosylase
MLNQWLERANAERPELPPLRREDCWVDNTVRCHLKRGNKDRAPTVKETAFCAEAHLKPALRALPNLVLVIPVGVPAIQGIFGEDAGELWAGGTYKVEGWL